MSFERVDPIMRRLKASPELRLLSDRQWREIESVLFGEVDAIYAAAEDDWADGLIDEVGDGDEQP